MQTDIVSYLCHLKRTGQVWQTIRAAQNTDSNVSRKDLKETNNIATTIQHHERNIERGAAEGSPLRTEQKSCLVHSAPWGVPPPKTWENKSSV